tara:strand:- start:772 stop:1878 length:1107 start_codon:yes stop_codon:yes gene_type:complete
MTELFPSAVPISTAHKGMQAVVTGGSGFIGHHLVRQLADDGFSVRVLDLAKSDTLDERAEFVEGSILNRSLVRDVVGDAARVFHLAADPNLWARDKSSFMRVNYQGTCVVLEESALAGVNRIVHTSTESILKGKRGAQWETVDEGLARRLADMPGPYCRSKFLAEQAAIAAAKRGIPVVIVNPTLPIGPGDRRLTPPSRMLLDFINGKNPAYLDFGMNMIDVRDAALGHMRAAEYGQIGHRYILGGENIMLAQVLLILRELTGLPMPRTRIPFALALGVAAISEFMSDHVTKTPPKASLTGVRIAGADMIFDCTKARTELKLTPRPVREALLDAVSSFTRSGLVDRALPATLLAPANPADGNALTAGA